ncbi:MAG: cytochrome c [Bacteroidetes bacterium]|nr:cytochrome c [Bacteroidota bacterium]
MKLFLPALIALALQAASCGSGSEQAAPDNQTPAPAANAQTLYAAKCVVCHGNDGKAAIGGAYDLSTSTLDKAGAAAVITNGRKAMRAYKDELTPAEIDSLAAYLQTLKK